MTVITALSLPNKQKTKITKINTSTNKKQVQQATSGYRNKITARFLTEYNLAEST